MNESAKSLIMPCPPPRQSAYHPTLFQTSRNLGEKGNLHYSLDRAAKWSSKSGKDFPLWALVKMVINRSILWLVTLFCCAQTAGAQMAPVDCKIALGDCLIQEAKEIAQSIPDPDQSDEAFFAVAITQAAVGQIAEALANVDAITSERTKAEALAELVGAEARLGHFESAHRIALGILDSRSRSTRVNALENLAAEQARRGEIDAAFETVIAIDNPYRRSEAQAAIATAVARSGNISGAIQTASKIATDYWFKSDQHSLKVASGLVSRAGEFDDFWFFEALGNISDIQARGGDIRGALKTARAIPDVSGRTRAYNRIAAVQARNGDLEGAMKTAGRIESAFGDLPALVAIVGAMAAQGSFDAAIELAGNVEAAYGDDTGFVAVAVEMARQNQLEAGLGHAKALASAKDRTRAFSDIAVVLAQKGGVEDALRITSLITDRRDQAQALHAVATALAAGGDSARALQVAATTPDPIDLNALVVDIALAQAQSGDTQGAIATARLVDDSMSRAIALSGIARVLP